MKIARFQKDRTIAHGVVQGNKIIEIRGSIYRRFRTTDFSHNLNDVHLLAPTEPVQIWQPGMNFAAHLAHAVSITGIHDLPKTPQPWVKGRNSLNNPGGDIVIPKDSGGDVHYEGEAVAVIGRQCRRVSEKDAPDYILGYTCGNDVSERAWQKNDNFMWRAKGSDTFCPVGPWIETEMDAGNLEIVVRLNGKEVQRASTKDMLFSFARLVSYISQQATLYPGDLVFSGTTGTTSRMKPGDVVEVTIDGIGVLRNPVVAEN
jgi:2-keto-4-pentenoate hydratase/2-oxohepta-3-ene-1,7-dioic acid hydratase in catechol pathway